MKVHTTNHTHTYIQVHGIRVHYTKYGQGTPTLVFLHGSFLSMYSWRHVLEPLSNVYTIIALDRIAFGKTERPIPDTASSLNPYSPEAQADLTIAIMDKLNVEHAVLVGNSTGGTIALLTALRHPSRVQALCIIGGMVYSGYPVSEMPAWVRRIIPSSFGAFVVRSIIGRAYNAMIRSFWSVPTRMPPEVLNTYRSLLEMNNWDRAVWELIQATHHLHLDKQLASIQVPTLVLTGAHDKTVPLVQSLRLVKDMPQAGLIILPDCGHLPQEECPKSFIRALTRFLHTLTSP